MLHCPARACFATPADHPFSDIHSCAAAIALVGAALP